jgi:hypothetical protein
VELGDQQISAWGNDYLFLDGDFVISYIIPKIVQGKYKVFLGADAYNVANALVEVYIDGKNIGRLFDLSTGGSSAYPFTRIELGIINFARYERHTVEIRSLIPGRFCWDYVRFEPSLPVVKSTGMNIMELNRKQLILISGMRCRKMLI